MGKCKMQSAKCKMANERAKGPGVTKLDGSLRRPKEEWASKVMGSSPAVLALMVLAFSGGCNGVGAVDSGKSGADNQAKFDSRAQLEKTLGSDNVRVFLVYDRPGIKYVTPKAVRDPWFQADPIIDDPREVGDEILLDVDGRRYSIRAIVGGLEMQDKVSGGVGGELYVSLDGQSCTDMKLGALSAILYRIQQAVSDAKLKGHVNVIIQLPKAE